MAHVTEEERKSLLKNLDAVALRAYEDVNDDEVEAAVAAAVGHVEAIAARAYKAGRESGGLAAIEAVLDGAIVDLTAIRERTGS